MSVWIAIELERPEATFEHGESVAGQVTIRADAPVTCSVPLHLEHHAHGKGDTWTESVTESSLFSGTLEAGEERMLPFAFPVPESARPYAGKIFQVEMRLRAVAAVEGEPSHRHTEVTAPLNVAPAAVPAAFRVAPLSETTDASGMGCLFQSLGLVLLGGLVVALAVAMPDIGFIAPLGGTVAVVGIALALVVHRRALAERKVGAVSVSIAQEGAEGYRDVPGSSPLTATITTRASGATATVRLRVQESSRRGIGNDSFTHTEALHDETLELTDSSPGTFRGQLTLPNPSEVPLPFRAGRHQVEWEVFVTLDAPGAPEWLHRYELEVTGA